MKRRFFDVNDSSYIDLEYREDEAIFAVYAKGTAYLTVRQIKEMARWATKQATNNKNGRWEDLG